MISKSDQHRNLVLYNDYTESTHRLRSRLLIVSGKYPNRVNAK